MREQLNPQTRMMDAGYRVFGTHRYRKASISEIAMLASVSKASVFHYFKTKKGLYLALLENAGLVLLDAIQQGFDDSVHGFFDRIRQSTAIKMRVLSVYPGMLDFLSKAYFEEDPEVRDEVASFMNQDAFNALRAHVMNDDIDTDAFKKGIDPAFVGKLLMWISYGMAATQNSESFDVDATLMAFNQTLELFEKYFCRGKDEHNGSH